MLHGWKEDLTEPYHRFTYLFITCQYFEGSRALEGSKQVNVNNLTCSSATFVSLQSFTFVRGNL